MADTEADKSGESAEAEGAEGAGTGTESEGTEGDAADGDDAGGEGDARDGKADDTEADDGVEPETRKKPIDFILARKDAKIAKLAGKAEADKSAAGNGDGEGNGESDDDGVAQEDKDIVMKTVMPFIEPLLKQNAAQENEKELTAFLAANSDFKPYEAKIRRYMEHPTRSHLPVKAIAYEVAGDKLLAIGAKRGKVADDKAKGTQTGGGSAREGGGEKSVWDMSPEEFALEQQKTRSKQR